MELLATMALDRDAINTVTLRLLPPSAAASAASCWLLLHTVPITASLSRTLSRLVSIEEAATAHAPADISLATPHAAPSPSAPSSPPAAGSGPEPTRSSATKRWRACSRSSSEPASVSPNPSFTAVSGASAAAAESAVQGNSDGTDRARRSWIELVRVGYIMSEIHAYCILLKCRTVAQATQIKAALEEGAALGVTAPVEYVSDAQPVAVTRRTFTEAPEATAIDDAVGVAVVDAASFVLTELSEKGDRDDTERESEGTGGTRAGENATAIAATPSVEERTLMRQAKGPHWHTEVRTTSLLDAVTMVYPVREESNDEDVQRLDREGRDDAKGRAEDVNRDGRLSTREDSLSNSQHPYNTSRHSNTSTPQHQARTRAPAASPKPFRYGPRRSNSEPALSAPVSPSLPARRSPVPVDGAGAAVGGAPSTPPLSTASTFLLHAARNPRTGNAISKGAAPPLPMRQHQPALLPSSVGSSPQPAPSGSRVRTPLHLPHPSSDANLNSRTNGEGASSSTWRLDGDHEPAAPTTADAIDCTAAPSDNLEMAGRRGEEFCAICQVDPLRCGACVMTLCQHSFHLSCYAQLPSAECPLCRFSLYDLLNDAHCEVCRTYEDLWVCLICGHVACGRARRDHQQEHYRTSGHSCSWQSSTNRIRNLSSHMFLHQEVALLLEGDAEEEEQPAAFGPRGGASSNASGSRGGAARHAAPSAMDRLRHVSWSDPLDSELQEALNESKEDAVAQYYTAFLRQLAAEQQQWYEARLQEVRRRRERRQWRAAAVAGQRDARRAAAAASSTGAERGGLEETGTPPQRLSNRDAQAKSATSRMDEKQLTSAAFVPSSQATLYAALHGVIRSERRERRRLLAEYIPATVELLQQAQRACTNLHHSLRTARDDAQQQVLLRSHFNTGLVAQMDQVRQRTHEAIRKGEKDLLLKSEEEARLQRRVEEALSAL